MSNLIFLVLLMALGKLSQRIPAFPDNTSQVLNQFVIYLSLPATILLKIGSIEFVPSLAVLALVPWCHVLVTVGLVVLLSKIFKWDNELTGAVMLAAALGNTSFLGFPAVASFFGDQFLGYAIIYDQFGSFLAVAIFGTIVLSVYGRSEKITVRQVMVKIVTFPPFIALILGVVLHDTRLPDMIHKMLQSLSVTLVPVVIFSVGAMIKFRQPKTNINPILFIMAFKMVISPVIIVLLLSLTDIRGMIFNITVFEAGMPPMVMAGILAAAGKLKHEVATAAIGYGMILSFVTLPVLYFIIKQY